MIVVRMVDAAVQMASSVTVVNITIKVVNGATGPC